MLASIIIVFVSVLTMFVFGDVITTTLLPLCNFYTEGTNLIGIGKLISQFFGFFMTFLFVFFGFGVYSVIYMIKREDDRWRQN
jgi:hypothetical protein